MEQVNLDSFSTLPCIFNENINEVKKDKLKSLKHKLDLELKDYDDHEEEKICKLNFLSWIEFKLRDFCKAKNRNEEVMRLISNANVTALLGRAMIALETGNSEEANTSLRLLDTFTSQATNGHDIAIYQSKAQLAYCFLRFGNLDLEKRSLDLYTEVVEKQPTNYFWKCKLGLVHSRICKTKAFRKRLERIDNANQAVKYYCDVITESKNTDLIREAYTQLIQLRTACDKHKVAIQLDNHILKQNFKGLIQKTLSIGSEDSYTLSNVAEALRVKGDLNEAIEHFEKSLQLKHISKTFQSLGKCYQEMGDESKARYNFEQAIKISHDNNFSAVCDFGKFLKSCDLKDKALEKFRLITDQSSLMIQWDYLHDLANAYVQSGLILLEKSKQEHTDSLKEKAEYYLLQALNVNCILKQSQDKSLEYICDLLAKDKLEVPIVISRLRCFKFRINNFQRELKSEFLSKNYELAFTLVSLFESKNKVIPQDLGILMSKVKCYTAAHRIKLHESTVHFITKPLFESSIQPVARGENSPTLTKCIDVLILCDHKKTKKF